MIVIEPVRVPVWVGVNVTLILQVAPALSVLPQVFVCAKSPVAGATEIVVLLVPVFLTVMVLLGLVVLTACDAKVSLVGVTVIVTPVVPVPVRLIICGESDA